MVESLFAQRSLNKRRLFFMVLGSLMVHGAIVGAAYLAPTNKSFMLPEQITELDVDTQLGEEVQELIVAREEPTPEPMPEPTPPPMPEATPEPETPPPAEEPDMTEPEKPTPAPTPKKEKPKEERPKPAPAPPKPVPARPASTPAPANAKRGDVPQPGVVGGVTKAEKTTGTPGGSKIGTGWKTPKPPYPYQARASRIQGSGMVRISTDGSGRVISAVVVQSVGNGILDSNTTNFARANWKGPPNATTTVPVTYRLQ